MDEPSRNKDPVAAAVFSIAILLLLGLVVYVVFFLKRPEPVPVQPGVVEEIRRLAKALQPKAETKRDTKPEPGRAEKPAVAGAPLQAGRTWRYAVTVEPPVWRDITLTYRTQREGDSIGVLTDFLYAGGKTNFHLGIFAPNHPSHENTRFPGFFMYAAYLKQPLAIGQPIAFGWHWQGKSAGSVKRFEGQVMAWEDLQLPGGNLNAAKIEGTLTYREDGQFRGGARETFWYAPKVSQIVKIVRDGITPDESARRIVAELAAFR